MTRSELLQFLEQIGAFPKKGLSQNFLVDQNIVRKIVELAEVKNGDSVLEIGPGPGALTEALLAAGARVLAVEKDHLFAKHLLRFQTADERLQVECADVLKFPFEQLTSGRWKVVANLPYNITTPILEKLVGSASRFESFTLMMQKEVADRIQAKPSTKAFGSLTLFLQFHTRVHGAFAVAPTCFYPAPSVHSTVLRLNTRTPPAVDETQLFALIHRAFQQRRKMLTSSLREIGKEVAEALVSIGVVRTARPEELSLEQWISFAKKLGS